jgi:hypothetical protein
MYKFRIISAIKRTLTFITFAPSFTTLAALALAAFFAGHGVHVVAGKGDRARRAGWADQSLKNASQKLQKEQLTDLEFSFSPHQSR